MNRRIPLQPAEGWISLGLVMLLCLSMAWAIDDVALILGNEAFTDFLGTMAIAGVLIGFIGAKVGWGRWLTYLIGAIFAALIVPLVIGYQLDVKGPAVLDAYTATAASLVDAVVDLTIDGQTVTAEYGHYMLFLGLLVWGTSMFAAYATFGHRRPLNAIVITGLVLLITMSLTYNDQVRFLVLFTIAALVLLVRYHVLDEQTEWIRRRIGDPATISTVYLRGGTVFIAVAIVGSILLMNVARSAPLEGTLAGFSNNFVELSRSIQRFLPTGGNTKPIGNDFDPNSTSIRGKWQPNPALVATVKLPVTDKLPYYWRAATFDQFTLNGWKVSGRPAKVEVDSNDPLLEGTVEGGDLEGTVKIEFTVTPAPDAGSILLSPATPTFTDVPTTLTLAETAPYFGAIERREDGTYTVEAQVRTAGTKPLQLTQAALRDAGTDYPADIERLYGAEAVPEGAIPPGGKAEQLLDQLVADAGDLADNPFDFATYLRTRFIVDKDKGGLFKYDTNVNDLMERECKDISIVECFAEYGRGFCQHYATTMTIFLRAQGIPARIVEGYLPGKRTPQGEERVDGQARHQWVEVYFPRYGWVIFDPTGGNVSRQETLPAGIAGASLPPLSSAGAFPQPTRRLDLEPDDSPTAPGQARIPVGGLIAVAMLLAVIVGGLAFIAWQRGPRTGTTADHAYRTVTRIAARFGFGPRPNQTVYEYSGSLGEVLPVVRPELELVAQAKVETVYGRGSLGDDRLQALRAAERRLRLNLLRLAFRRRDRRRR